MFKTALFKETIILVFILLILDFMARQFDLYYQSVGGEFDSLMHFLGGVLVASSFLWLYFFSGFFSPTNRKYAAFFRIAVFSIIFVGIAWEIYELLVGQTFTSDLEYPYDTTLDYIMDFSGAIAVSIYAYKKTTEVKPH